MKFQSYRCACIQGRACCLTPTTTAFSIAQLYPFSDGTISCVILCGWRVCHSKCFVGFPGYTMARCDAIITRERGGYASEVCQASTEGWGKCFYRPHDPFNYRYLGSPPKLSACRHLVLPLNLQVCKCNLSGNKSIWSLSDGNLIDPGSALCSAG